MDLEQLKKRLYKKDDGIEGRPKPPEIFEPGHESVPPAEQLPQWSAKDTKMPFRGMIKRKIFWSAIILAMLVLASLIFWFFWSRGHSFDKAMVALNIYGQERIVSGEEVNYIVRFKNNNSQIGLKNVVLEFIYPEQSSLLDNQEVTRQGNLLVAKKNLGDMAVGQEGQAEFRIRVLGDKDSQQKFSARLSYRPANINSDFINETQFSSVIISVPLVLNFDLPEKLVSGQTINFTLKYLNTSNVAFNDFKIQLEYPSGFTFNNAYPSPSEGDNIWFLAEIGIQEEGRIIIKGTLNGNEGESKIFRAKIGTAKDETFAVYAETLASPQISASPLYVEQSLANKDDLIANLDQSLNYRIKYRNTTSVTIGPVIIFVKINSQAVDWESIEVRDGFFNSVDNTIIWNTSSLPALNSLASQQEGEIDFSLRLKDKISISKFSDKNFTILTTAEIDSPNVPISLIGMQLKGTNEMIVKVNSRLVLNTKGYYKDNLMQNTGPIPPRVGQQTTYTVYWQILNVSNDLSDVLVEAFLPSYVQWLGKIYPTGEDLKYDSGTGKVTWRIGKLSSATGILLPVKQVAFQIGLLPSISQIDQVVVIVKEARASGLDTFTSVETTNTARELKSDLPDDPTVGWQNGKVGQ